MTFQTTFVTAVLSPEKPAPAGGTRFAVYRNNVVTGLIDALTAGFPAIHSLVGDQFFKAMAGLYVRHYPPHSPLMMHFGQDMPRFLAGFSPVAHLPYLPDVARLELAIRDSYHAADSPPPSPPEGDLNALCIDFAPATRIIASDHPVGSIRLAALDPEAPRPSARAETVLITRPDFDPVLTILTPDAGRIALQLLLGHRIGEVASQHGFDEVIGTLIRTQAIKGFSQ